MLLFTSQQQRNIKHALTCVIINSNAVSVAVMGLSFAVIFILSIDICIESGPSVVNHMAVDKLAGLHVSRQQFLSQ